MSMDDGYLRALIDRYVALDSMNTSQKRGPKDAGPYVFALECLAEAIGAKYRQDGNASELEDYLCLRNAILTTGGLLLQFLSFGRLDSEEAYRVAEQLWERGFNFFGPA